MPPDADGYLVAQRLADGAARIHLDLHVADPILAADAAVGLGATELVRYQEMYVGLRSPGGFLFCFVSHPASTRARAGDLARTAPGRRSTRSASTCPRRRTTPRSRSGGPSPAGSSRRSRSPSSSACSLRPASRCAGCIQRLDNEDGPVRAHLDLACDDRDAEVARHVALGATEGPRHEWWTVLTDPVGTTYCITRRTPSPAPTRP